MSKPKTDQEQEEKWIGRCSPVALASLDVPIPDAGTIPHRPHRRQVAWSSAPPPSSGSRSCSASSAPQPLRPVARVGSRARPCTAYLVAPSPRAPMGRSRGEGTGREREEDAERRLSGGGERAWIGARVSPGLEFCVAAGKRQKRATQGAGLAH